MGLIADRAKEAGKSNAVFLEDQRNILLPGAFAAADNSRERFTKKLYRKRAYDPSNEMKVLASAIIWSAWCAWVFKAKSEDPDRPEESRNQAEAVSKICKTTIVNAIRVG